VPVLRLGSGDAHQLRNDSSEDVCYLELGGRNDADDVVYPDDDLALKNQDGVYTFTHKNGDAYPEKSGI